MVTAILLLTLVHHRLRASLLRFPLTRGFGKSLPSVFARITIPPKCFFLYYLRLLLFGAHFSHGSFWFGRIFFRNGLSFVIQSTNGESNNKGKRLWNPLLKWRESRDAYALFRVEGRSKRSYWTSLWYGSSSKERTWENPWKKNENLLFP